MSQKRVGQLSTSVSNRSVESVKSVVKTTFESGTAIDLALAAHRAEGGQAPEVPLALASKRAAQLGNLPRAAKRRRLLAYLARRGFTGSEIGAIVKQVVG